MQLSLKCDDMFYTFVINFEMKGMTLLNSCQVLTELAYLNCLN